METIKSFKGYGKVDPAEDHEFRRRTRKRLTVIGVSSVLLLLLVVGAVVGVVLSRKGGDDSSGEEESSTAASGATAQSIKAVCAVTLHPDSCFSSLASESAANLSGDPEELFKLSLSVARDGISKISSLPAELLRGVKDPRVKQALQVCTESISDSIDQLNESLSQMNPVPGEALLTPSKIDNLRTWLSAVLTNQETCLDAFEGTTGGLREKLQAALRNSTEFTSNSLAIATHIPGVLKDLGIPIHRKLLGAAPAAEFRSGTPDWVRSDPAKRRLLQSVTALRPDVTVAQDGTGQVKTIAEALAMVPKRNGKQFVISVKAGKYLERVVVDKNMWNVVMVGDGMDKTVVSGSLNFVDGIQTMNTASFVVEGRGFAARFMGFENTAGPQKHQAVAARVKSDRSIFYQCSFDAYQDTLYTHAMRQFYRECDVRGTVDFIFGNAAAVLQKCAIRPREPMANQQNTVTAQGKVDRNQNTGIAIEACTVSAFDRLTRPTFLGRPWKPFSTTVVVGSDIGALVDPRGWLSWDGGSSEPPATIFYAEHRNTGPGASTAGRVKWAGYKPWLADSEAQKFTVGPFIQGTEWIPNELTL